MNKLPFVSKEQLDEIMKEFPTPFHLYDEKGIRENAKALKEAFAWNKGFKEYLESQNIYLNYNNEHNEQLIGVYRLAKKGE